MAFIFLFSYVLFYWALCTIIILDGRIIQSLSLFYTTNLEQFLFILNPHRTVT